MLLVDTDSLNPSIFRKFFTRHRYTIDDTNKLHIISFLDTLILSDVTQYGTYFLNKNKNLIQDQNMCNSTFSDISII